MHVAVISGSRADFGYLLEPIRLLAAAPDHAVTVVLTGQHLLPGFAAAAQTLQAEGISPVLVDIGLGAGDDAAAIARAAGQAIAGIGAALASVRPDLILVLGDRYEIVAAAIAATLARIPIAHIAGGDLTEGAIDDAFRHAITAMAHVHFATNAVSGRRLAQLGQPADRIHVVGSPSLDLALKSPRTDRATFLADVGLRDGRPGLLVTFHPVTRAADSLAQLEELLAALDSVDAQAPILITGANADPEGQALDRRLRAFAAGRDNSVHVPSLGSVRYFNALSHMDVVVGNSSSGLYEAPSFALPTLNIGDRQAGRLKAASVIDCPPERIAIVGALAQALAQGRRPVQNPYGDGRASQRIVAILSAIDDPQALLAKEFKDLVT